MTTVTRTPGLALRWLPVALRWLLANLLGFGLAGALFHNFPLAFTFPPTLTRLGAFRLEPAVVGFVFGAVPALLVGGLQWFLLRHRRPVSRWWLISSSAGLGLTHFLSDGFESAEDLSLAVLAGGLVVGLIQWRLLRPHGPAARWCVPVNGLIWYGGWALGLAFLDALGWRYRNWAPGLDFQQHGIIGLSVGLVSGVGLGALLIGLSRRAGAPASRR